jgi:hypothetical protein
MFSENDDSVDAVNELLREIFIKETQLINSPRVESNS